jgi:hypothetical protein
LGRLALHHAPQLPTPSPGHAVDADAALLIRSTHTPAPRLASFLSILKLSCSEECCQRIQAQQHLLRLQPALRLVVQHVCQLGWVLVSGDPVKRTHDAEMLLLLALPLISYGSCHPGKCTPCQPRSCWQGFAALALSHLILSYHTQAHLELVLAAAPLYRLANHMQSTSSTADPALPSPATHLPLVPPASLSRGSQLRRSPNGADPSGVPSFGCSAGWVLCRLAEGLQKFSG